MPVYLMLCKKCGLNKSIRKNMKDEFPKKCPDCKSTKYGQDYSSLGRTLSLDNIDPVSAGRQGEINYKKRGQRSRGYMAVSLNLL